MNIEGIGDKLTGNTVKSSKDRSVDQSFEKHLKDAVEKKDEKELKKACEDFEAIFLNMMYKQMKATVPKSELIPGDIGRDIFDSMLDDSLMGEAARNNSLALGDTLFKQLSKNLKSNYRLDSLGEEPNGEKK